jgi:hypothetical protein
MKRTSSAQRPASTPARGAHMRLSAMFAPPHLQLSIQRKHPDTVGRGVRPDSPSNRTALSRARHGSWSSRPEESAIGCGAGVLLTPPKNQKRGAPGDPNRLTGHRPTPLPRRGVFLLRQRLKRDDADRRSEPAALPGGSPQHARHRWHRVLTGAFPFTEALPRCCASRIQPAGGRAGAVFTRGVLTRGE